jgi:hypothetical protein
VDPKIIAVWVLLLSATLSWRACGRSIPAISFSCRVSLWWPWPGLSSLLSSSAQHRYLQENWCLRFGRKLPSSSGKLWWALFLWRVTALFLSRITTCVHAVDSLRLLGRPKQAGSPPFDDGVRWIGVDLFDLWHSRIHFWPNYLLWHVAFWTGLLAVVHYRVDFSLQIPGFSLAICPRLGMGLAQSVSSGL